MAIAERKDSAAQGRRLSPSVRWRGASGALLALLVTGALHAESPLLEVDQMTFVGSRGPTRELVLRARHARIDTDRERVFLDDVHALVQPGSNAGHFEIRCESGELDLASNDFEASGNVRGETEGGRQFTAPWVKYDHERGLLFTNAPVLISEDAITYRGGGLEYFVRERRFRLLGGASVVQEP
jgi:hypothetical protein